MSTAQAMPILAPPITGKMTVGNDTTEYAHDDTWCSTECVHFGGIKFDNVNMDEAIARIDLLVRRGGSSMVVTPNVDHVMRLQGDQEYARLVEEADLVLADGQPIVWATRLLGKPLKERVAGSDLVPKLCAYAARRGLRVFFLGGAPGAAAAAEARLKEQYPTLKSVGIHCPAYDFEQNPGRNREVVEAVRRARPDILFVGLGSPKQEKWIAAHMHEYGVPVSLGIGISFSFIAGHVKRAPLWMQKASLEWLHRLLCEPRRLWKRYLVRGPRFLGILASELAMAQPNSKRYLRGPEPADWLLPAFGQHPPVAAASSMMAQGAGA